MPGSVIKSGVSVSRSIIAPKTKVDQSIQGGTNIALVSK
jgi:hypothetical protein